MQGSIEPPCNNMSTAIELSLGLGLHQRPLPDIAGVLHGHDTQKGRHARVSVVVFSETAVQKGGNRQILAGASLDTPSIAE